MADVTPSPDIHLMLGEMRGQLREMVHTGNNTAAKIDALGREIAEVKGITVTVAAMEVRLKACETDIGGLKEERAQRRGALSLGEWLIRAIPWLLGGAAFAVATKLLELGP